MRTIAKQHQYALSIPAEDPRALSEAQKQTGQSINQLIVLCVRKALPDMAATFAASKRVTAKKLSAFQV